MRVVHVHTLACSLAAASLCESTRATAPDLRAPRGQGRLSVEHQACNLHAAGTVAATDRNGRERLCRYGARPPFALRNLSRLPDGRIAYRLKYDSPGRRSIYRARRGSERGGRRVRIPAFSIVVPRVSHSTNCTG